LPRRGFLPEISLDAPNDKVVIPTEKFSDSVRFDRVSDFGA
jgi:hypothetical protein